MSESLYRRNPKNNVINVITARRGLVTGKQTIGGKSAQVRNPVFAYVTGHDMSCGGGGSLQIPDNKPTWGEQYSSFKPKPQLESVKLEYGGDWGLARKLSANIKCYTVGDFLNVQKYFLLPGNEIDVRFGYEVNWGIGQPTTSLTGFKVATFNFNTTSEGFWICSFEAVSSSTAIENLDMQLVVCNGCNAIGGSGQSGTSGPLKYITGDGGEQHPVKGVAQLIASDSQGNGVKSIDKIQDGEVVTSFTDYNPGSYDNSAAIVIYTGDHIRDPFGKMAAWVGGIIKSMGGGESEVESANNQVYVSLGYIINRIINDQLLRALTCMIAPTPERAKFNKIKVEFHPIYSKSVVSDGITSGDPLNMLMLGRGSYINVKNEGKNFDADCKNLSAVKCHIGGGQVKLQNILLHRDVIIAAFNEATQVREGQMDWTGVKDTKEEVINVMDFFKKIADQISSCTGGAIALRLVENPDNPNTLIVVDQNFGISETLKCVVFDPIDGDGSVRTCEIQSNVGSQEYKAAMFVGSSKKSDATATLRSCNEELKDRRLIEHDKARSDSFALIKNPGNLGKNYFNGQDINALKSIMTRLHRSNELTPANETMHYPGLSISLEIDGVWGFEPGNAVSSTQVPAKWRNQMKSYFMVTKVSQEITTSDWVTKIDGILAYYNNIEYK